MAIEIKELHLKFNLENAQGSNSSSEDCGCSGTDSAANSTANQAAIVQTCIDEVLRVLELKASER